MIKEKLYLKDDLPDKIPHILFNTEYKNTDMDQYIKPIKKNK